MLSQTTPITTTGTNEAVLRQTLADFTDYRGAQAMVDQLSDAGFPVQTVRIVGSGLRAVEYVTGRVTPGRAATRGALSGLWFGLLFSLLFALFLSGPGAGLLVFAPLFAAAGGAVFGYASQWSTRGRRDFASVSGFETDTFEVTVASELADQARRLVA